MSRKKRDEPEEMQFEDEEEEDEEDEEEEEDEDDDEGEDSRPKKKARNTTTSLIDMEADVDDEADEDEEDEDGEGGADFMDEAEEADRAAQQMSGIMRARQRDRLEEDKDVAEIARDIERRHADYALEEDVGDIEMQSGSDLTQQATLPSMKDPKLWMIKCKVGKERELVVQLMNKFMMHREKGLPMYIKSVIAAEHLKGYIYVEAHKDSHVKAAIQGLRSLIAWSLKLVPMNEMPDILQVAKQTHNVAIGGWVRIRRGVYRGDIGQIRNIDDSGSHLVVKLVPRLDMDAIKNKGTQQEPVGGEKDPKKRKRQPFGQGPRPPQRFFNADEVGNITGNRNMIEVKRDSRGQEYYVFDGSNFQDGYVLKRLMFKSLILDGAPPTLDELQKFKNMSQDGEGGGTHGMGDLLDPTKLGLPTRKIAFSKGDVVKIKEGDLKNLMGIVQTIEGDNVTIMPQHTALNATHTLIFPAEHLLKYFKTGDHVKVMAGRYEGETGHVVLVQDNIVTLFSDLQTKEIKVFVHDVQSATEVASGLDQIGEFELHDLVEINQQTAGVIVKVERESFKVVDNNGVVKTLTAHEIKKKDTKRAVCLDIDNNSMQQGDIVKVIKEKEKGRTGTIKHVFRTFLFLHAREVLDNAGIFVVRGRAVKLLGGKNKSDQPTSSFGRGGGAGGFAPGFMSAGGRGGHGGAGRGGTTDRSLIQQTVRIISGTYKNYAGIVVDVTENSVRVELHTKGKTISVPKAGIRTVAADGRTMDAGVPMPSMYTPQNPFQTPHTPGLYGTPMHGGPRTPAYDGGRTPMWDGARTPMWEGARTPMHGDDYNRTPARDYGEEPTTPARPTTPGWNNEWNNDGQAGTPSGQTGTPYGYVATPSDQVPLTPSGDYYRPPTTPHGGTPGLPPQTPNPGSPGMDPGTPNSPATPGYALGPNTPAPMDVGEDVWIMEGLEVEVMTGRYHQRVGVVRRVTASNVDLECPNGEMLHQAPSNLKPVVPQKKDLVTVISTENRGMQGELLQIQDEDVVVKLSSGQVKLFLMADLCKRAR